ncbi:hypothetical protein ROZALSC1DRAFT_27630, partial [Rozella allomycis CSF55]
PLAVVSEKSTNDESLKNLIEQYQYHTKKLDEILTKISLILGGHSGQSIPHLSEFDQSFLENFASPNDDNGQNFIPEILSSPRKEDIDNLHDDKTEINHVSHISNINIHTKQKVFSRKPRGIYCNQNGPLIAASSLDGTVQVHDYESQKLNSTFIPFPGHWVEIMTWIPASNKAVLISSTKDTTTPSNVCFVPDMSSSNPSTIPLSGSLEPKGIMDIEIDPNIFADNFSFFTCSKDKLIIQWKVNEDLKTETKIRDLEFGPIRKIVRVKNARESQSCHG